MKRFYLLSLLTSFIIMSPIATASADGGRRLVLIEEFTNTGCGPCASWSPVLDSCINYRLGDCIAIKYHSAYPNAKDEFYLNDKNAQQARVDYYHINAVPTTFVDGQELDTRSFGYLSDAISYCQDTPEKCGISLEKKLEGNGLTVSVTVSSLPGVNVDASNEGGTSDLRLFVCAIEEHIVSASPYPNGESELYYTMRKMLTPADGAAVSLGSGITRSPANAPGTLYNMFWTADTFNDLSQLGVVAFVQDKDTREILATAYSGPNAEGENQLTLQNLYDTPDLICMPDYYGKVIFRNDGANAITSATLNVKVNGTVKQYPWTGNLGYLERDTLAFDGFTEFELSERAGTGTAHTPTNNVEVWFSDINGSDAVSNTRTSSFSNSVQASYGVQLKIYTDKKPEETTWKLYDSGGDVVREGGPYTGQARKFITVDLELTREDCYLLELLDAGGDGIKGSAGNGYYQLYQKDENGKTTRVAQGDYSGSVFDLHFRLVDRPQPPRRMVLFEEFTNTSCDPCADFSPALDEVLYRRMGDVVAITYHYNFPSPQDPFYLVSADDVKARANYYGVTGVPSLRVNGEHAGALGYEEYLDTYIDWGMALEAKADIDTEATIADGLLTADVAVSNLNSQSSDLKLFVAAVEERVEWDKSAANGERSWNYVLRKMLAGGEGQAIDIDPDKVTPYNYSFTWQIENYSDPTELGIVSFVQDMTTGEVLATTYTPRPTGSTSAAKILKVLNTPDRICSPLFTSDLMVRNTGRKTLTKATINVSFNGSVQQTPWTGRLDYLEIDTLHTPVFTDFALNPEPSSPNSVEIWLSDLNGTEEESVHKTLALASAYKAQNAVRLTIMTDNAPEEISWTVTNSLGDIVAKGGPYTEARKKQVVDLPLYSDDCYKLVFEDAGGNGITGENGRGYYMLHEVGAGGKTRLLVQDAFTTATHSVHFSLDNAAQRRGDVNGDGAVDVADIAAIINVMAGTAVPGASPSTSADVNGDGTVDVADIAAIINLMAGH